MYISDSNLAKLICVYGFEIATSIAPVNYVYNYIGLCCEIYMYINYVMQNFVGMVVNFLQLRNLIFLLNYNYKTQIK